MNVKETCSTCGGSGREQNYHWSYNDNYDQKIPERGNHTCPSCDGKGYNIVYKFHPSDFDDDKSFPQAEYSKEQLDKLGNAIKKLGGR